METGSSRVVLTRLGAFSRLRLLDAGRLLLSYDCRRITILLQSVST